MDRGGPGVRPFALGNKPDPFRSFDADRGGLCPGAGRKAGVGHACSVREGDFTAGG